LLTFEQIKELIELVAERHLQGLEVERSGFRLKIDGQAAAQPVVYAAAPEAPAEATAAPLPPPLPSRAMAAPPAAAGSAPAAPAAAEKPAHAPGTHILTSPIVGTFYRSPSPDSPPFVEVGSRVKKGQMLCIIEAMKLMNEIECDMAGEIVKRIASTGQPVEYGQPLFAIRPR